MKDKEQVKKFLSNMFNNCQKRYKKNQVIITILTFRTIGKVVLVVSQYYKLIVDSTQQILEILVLFYAHPDLYNMQKKLKFVLSNYHQIISQIDRLKKRELLRREVKLIETRNHKVPIVFGLMMKVQVSPLQEHWEIFMVIRLVSVTNLKSKSGISTSMMCSL